MSQIKLIFVLVVLVFLVHAETSLADEWTPIFRGTPVNRISCDIESGLGAFEFTEEIKGFERFILGPLQDPMHLRLKIDDDVITTESNNPANFSVGSWSLSFTILHSDKLFGAPTNLNQLGNRIGSNTSYIEKLFEPLSSILKPIHIQISAETSECNSDSPAFDISILQNTVETLNLHFDLGKNGFMAELLGAGYRISLPTSSRIDMLKLSRGADYESIFSISNTEYLLDREIDLDLYNALKSIYFHPKAHESLDANYVLNLDYFGELCTNNKGTLLHLVNTENDGKKILFTMTFSSEGMLVVTKTPRILESSELGLVTAKYQLFPKDESLEKLAIYMLRNYYPENHKAIFKLFLNKGAFYNLDKVILPDGWKDMYIELDSWNQLTYESAGIDLIRSRYSCKNL